MLKRGTMMQAIEKQIDQLHMEDLRNRLHPSIFDENDEYDMLIVRLPIIREKFDSISLGFIITPEKSYQYNISNDTLDELQSRFESPYQTIDTLLDHLLKAFTKYQEDISEMEESLYTDNIETDYMAQWMDLKRDILRVERIMLRTSTVMNNMIDFYESTEGFPINHYVDIHEHCERILRSASLQLSKLDYLYNFYNTRTNEKMNRLIFILTIISAIFLPLNLVVGFFGMNTSGLPFTEGNSGTFSVIATLGVLSVISSFTFILWRNKNKYPK